MERYVPCLSVLLLFVPALRAEPIAAPAKPVKETWEAGYIENAKAGYFHTTIREVVYDDKELLADTQVMRLGVKREGKVLTCGRERRRGDARRQGDGRVANDVRRRRQDHADRPRRGRPTRHPIVGRRRGAKTPWDDSVVGQAKQDRLLQEKKVKPGDRFSYLAYQPTFQVVVTMRVTDKKPEEIDVLEVKGEGPDARPAASRRSCCAWSSRPTR